jgi:uncharacterized protein YcaQ
VALYYLWRTGEVMTHHREKFERHYALTEAVAPVELIYQAGEIETDRFLCFKEISFNGLTRLKRTGDIFYPGKKRKIYDQLFADGELIEVKVEGWKDLQVARSADAAALRALAAGRTPAAWKPLGPTTEEEVTFLAPLDPVSARGRAKQLFDFEYIWEVYKPEHLRRHGYYTLPILWGDKLVARFDSKLDRTTNTFVILGFWLEDQKLDRNAAFAEALAAGFARFRRFLGAAKLNAGAIKEPMLKRAVVARAGK